MVKRLFFFFFFRTCYWMGTWNRHPTIEKNILTFSLFVLGAGCHFRHVLFLYPWGNGWGRQPTYSSHGKCYVTMSGHASHAKTMDKSGRLTTPGIYKELCYFGWNLMGNARYVEAFRLCEYCVHCMTLRHELEYSRNTWLCSRAAYFK